MVNKTKKQKVSARKSRRCPKVPKPRNVHAVAARAMTGAGTHNDRRTRRQRTRGASKRTAIAEHS